jgi:SAM-dependent MidA family methyltransferase
MERALYGPGGFYLGHDGPAAHFRTSVHASPLFATAVIRLLREVDAVLGHPAELAFADLAAGRGELISAVYEQLSGDPLAGRLRLVAVELADRPAELPEDIEWLAELPGGGKAAERLTGLILANEYLDNVPCDVVELTANGPRQVLVAMDGSERLGAEPDPAALAWLAEWWPLTEVGQRAEDGRRRDTAWRATVGRLARGVAVAVDYSHTRDARPPLGTLTGYAHGRQVEPVPDSTCDLTAHVALDACAEATRATATWSLTLSQRQALRRLGISGERPEHAMAGRDPGGYLHALARAGQAAELTAEGGLGEFGWLIQGAGVPRLAVLED